MIERGALQGRFFDVLLVDWRMVGLDGVETLRRAAAMLGAGIPPSLLVTAHDDPQLRQLCQERRIGGVLLKPVTASALHDALSGLLQRDGPAATQDRPGAAEAQLLERYAGTHILLVEDNPVNQEVAIALLEKAHLSVDCAADGLTAVAMVGRKAYALILMDMQMPGIDGLEATRRIRQSGALSTPIIAMTANAFGEDQRACLEAGMDDHLAKPVDPEALYQMLLRWLAPRASPQAQVPANPPAPPEDARYGLRGLADRLAAIPGYSLARGLGATGGRLELLLRLLQSFVANYRHREGALREALRSGDLKTRILAAHSIRGACATAGAVAAEEQAADLETLLEAPGAEPSSATVTEATSRLDDELARLTETIARALER